VTDDPCAAITGIPLLYLREGFAACIIHLAADGTISHGPGHAEARWSWAENCLVLQDGDGRMTGRLEPRNGFYAGVILGRIAVTLRPLCWPCGYQFDGAVGRRLARIAQSPPMRYLLGIPFVNRRDLLERAVASIPAMRDRLVIVDNSNLRELRDRQTLGNELVYEPPVPLTFVQSMNLLQQMAHAAACDVLCVMHNDAEAEPGMDVRFLDLVEEIWRTDPQFGVVFTHYDALSAFNMTAIRNSGPWDNLFTGYFADVEYYSRLRRYGFKEIATDISVIHHRSMTIRSDPRLEHANAILFPAYERIFHELY
jgi:hypothetical protein